MLLLSRRNHQGLVIEPDSTVPGDMKVSELFGDQGIRIKVIEVDEGVVKLGIDAPTEFKILRNELDNWNEPIEGDVKSFKKPKSSGANMYRRRRQPGNKEKTES